MIPVKQAVAHAVDYAQEMLGDRAQGVLLEEVESAGTSGNETWLITLSMPRRDVFAAFSTAREYKTFAVSKDTGEVISMKMRQLAEN